MKFLRAWYYFAYACQNWLPIEAGLWIDYSLRAAIIFDSQFIIIKYGKYLGGCISKMACRHASMSTQFHIDDWPIEKMAIGDFQEKRWNQSK